MTPEQFEQICAHIETTGDGTWKTCRQFGVSTTDFYAAQKDEFLALRYARAKDEQIDKLAEETIELADNCDESMESVGKARLQVDARKWFAAKLRPKKYGDRIEQRLADSEGNALQVVFGVPRPGNPNREHNADSQG